MWPSHLPPAAPSRSEANQRRRRRTSSAGAHSRLQLAQVLVRCEQGGRSAAARVPGSETPSELVHSCSLDRQKARSVHLPENVQAAVPEDPRLDGARQSNRYSSKGVLPPLNATRNCPLRQTAFRHTVPNSAAAVRLMLPLARLRSHPGEHADATLARICRHQLGARYPNAAQARAARACAWTRSWR